MSFGSFDPQGNSQPMAEINTTPLVDVMLVLLVIFLITAPLVHDASVIDLPHANSQPVTNPPHVLRIAVTAHGSLLLDNQDISLEVLTQRFVQESSNDSELHLYADSSTRYARVAEVMAAASRSNLHRIAFVSQPEGK